MNRLALLGAATVGGLIAYRCLSPETRHRLTGTVKHRMMKHMEKMMASLPEDAPPKLVTSILPRLRAQNDQIIALLQEQNKLLRGRQRIAR
jgi:hypothetical protein